MLRLDSHHRLTAWATVSHGNRPERRRRRVRYWSWISLIQSLCICRAEFEQEVEGERVFDADGCGKRPDYNQKLQ